VGTLSGSDRIEILWADGSIQQQWLEVIVKSTVHTGLATDDVFFFGNAIGDSGLDNTAVAARVSATDVGQTIVNGASLALNIPITNLFDYDRNGRIDSTDVTIAQTHGTSNATGLKMLSLGPSGPFAPQTGSASADAASLVVDARSPASQSSGDLVPTHQHLAAWGQIHSAKLDANPIEQLVGNLLSRLGRATKATRRA